MLQQLIDDLVNGAARKALIAAAAGLVLTFLAAHGISSTMTVGDLVTSVVNGLISFVLVYLIPNKG